jgi:hypothetical protein
MQKISSYLYPNRIELLADLAGFTTEYTNVYQKTVKIYKGVDNVLEFDIKNADQKRIELSTTPSITDITLNVMDASGYAMGTYTVTPTATKGIATVTIPQADVADIRHQFLKYSVTASKDNATIPLYADSRFGAVGTIELIENAMPRFRDDVIYDRFSGEIDFQGTVKNHTSAIPCKFYEAIPATEMSFEVWAFINVGKKSGLMSSMAIRLSTCTCSSGSSKSLRRKKTACTGFPSSELYSIPRFERPNKPRVLPIPET